MQLFLTSDLWRLTSNFWGLEATMRMCCCWPSPPQPTLKEVGGFKNYSQGPELHDCGGTCTHDCDLVTGSFWGSHVRVAATIPYKIKSGEKIGNSSQDSDPVEVQKSQLDSVKEHCMKVHVLMEPALGPQLPAAVVPIATYGELHPGSSKVPVCLSNLSAHAMEIPAKMVVGQVIPANQVPPVVHPTRTAEETTNKASKGWVLEALDLQGLKEWPESEQK